MVNLILCFWLVFRNELSGRVLHRLMDLRRQYTAPFVVGFDTDLPCFVTDHTVFVMGLDIIYSNALEKIWWARQDSNLRPDRYERPALTN